jgi:N-acetylglucosaminyl-diphospho-decaprenol L-rhamnosyltransferase
LSIALLERDTEARRSPHEMRSRAAGAAPLVSVIVVHYNQPGALANMIDSVLGQGGNIEIIVVNTSREVTLPAVAQGCRVLNVDNVGFAAGANRGLEAARGEFLAICNADIVLPGATIERAVDFMVRNPAVGVVAPRLVNEDGSEQHGARRFYDWRSALWARCPLRGIMKPPKFFRRQLMLGERKDSPTDVDWAFGAMLFVRRAALAGPMTVFDPRYYLYMEDVDLCLEMWQRGWRVVLLPHLEVTHLHNRASRKLLSSAFFHHAASFLKFVLKHGGLPQGAR